MKSSSIRAVRERRRHTLCSAKQELQFGVLPSPGDLDPNAEEGEIRECRIEELSPGMITQQEVRTYEGALLVSKGQEVTPALISKLKNFKTRLTVAGNLTVSMPTTTLWASPAGQDK